MLQIDFLTAVLPIASLPLEGIYHAALKWLSYFNLGKLLKKISNQISNTILQT